MCVKRYNLVLHAQKLLEIISGLSHLELLWSFGTFVILCSDVTQELSLDMFP